MLAANGSILTILAISFERYYAICKPLKAGYKCTRLRAAIIIGLIWLLASILTSPILIMAKSRETVFMDGSPVYNCVLETDTYWTKMYVFVSMVTFFWLPLLVLMLVYWLIGRKLTRESVALGTTTSLTTTDSNLDPTGQAAKSLANLRSKLELCDSQKCTLLKSISAFFSSLNHDRYSPFRLSNPTKHQLSDNQFNGRIGDYRLANDRLSDDEGRKCLNGGCPFSNREHGTLTSSKSLCMDDQHPKSEIVSVTDANKEVAQKAQGELISTRGKSNREVGSDISPCGCLLKYDNNCDKRRPSKASLVSQFINQLFVPRRSTGCNIDQIHHDTSDLSHKCSADVMNKTCNGHGKIPADGYVSAPYGNEHLAPFDGQNIPNHETDQWSKSYLARRSSFARSCNNKSTAGQHDRRHHLGGCFEKEPRFRWIKQFSVASSANSVKTSSTMLPSECSLLNSDAFEQKSDSQRSPRPILQNRNSIRNDPCRLSGKKNARFEDADVVGVESRPDSSLSEANSSSCRSKSLTPESIQNDSLDIRSDIDNCDSTYNKAKNHGGQDHGLSSTINEGKVQMGGILAFRPKLTKFATTDQSDYRPMSNQTTPEAVINGAKANEDDLFMAGKRLITGRQSVCGSNSNPDLFNSKKTKRSSQTSLCCNHSINSHINYLYVVQDISKKQQMDSRRQVVLMLGFIVACFFLLFFPYRIFTLWLILSSEDQVLSLGMEAYYNLTYFSRILIYLHSAINPIAYNLISTKFRRAFMSILLCQGPSSRRQYINDHRVITNKLHSNENSYKK